MDESHRVPPDTHIGHIHRKVADLDRAIHFYREIMGFDLVFQYGTQAAFLSAGGYHHHIGLNTRKSKDASPPPPGSTGHYHFAINYPTRRDLAVALDRLVRAHLTIDGTSDHGTHEAIYLQDPDGNGIELAWDRDRRVWTKPDGSIEMTTKPLDLRALVGELSVTPASGA